MASDIFRVKKLAVYLRPSRLTERHVQLCTGLFEEVADFLRSLAQRFSFHDSTPPGRGVAIGGGVWDQDQAWQRAEPLDQFACLLVHVRGAIR